MTRDFMGKFAKLLGEELGSTLQQASYELGDILNSKNPIDRTCYLVEMQLIVNGIKPLMEETERKLFDFLLEHSELNIMPTSFDPREKGK